MPNYLHRTTKAYEVSIPTISLPEPVANYIQDPDMSAVVGFSNIYWTITGDVVTLMSVSERSAVDTALLEGRRDSTANQVDETEEVLRASLLVILDEFNTLRAQHGLADRTIGQMKTAIRGKLGS